MPKKTKWPDPPPGTDNDKWRREIAFLRLLQKMGTFAAYASSQPDILQSEDGSDPYPGIPKRFFFHQGISVSFTFGKDDYFYVEAPSAGGPVVTLRYAIPHVIDARSVWSRCTATLAIQGSLATAAALDADFPQIN